MTAFSVDDLVPVFQKLHAAGWTAILVGGQAVNIWVLRYERDSPGWRAFQPFTSLVLDYHGGLAEARHAMKVLNAKGSLNTAAEPSPNAGVLKVELGAGRELLIDVLTSVFGVSTSELERTAVTFTGIAALSALDLRVIHPVLLLESKAASLRGLPQAGRQDAKHLRLMLLVVRAWLLEQIANPRAVFKVVERLSTCVQGPDGLHAFVQGIDLLDAIPLDEMRAYPDFKKFFEQRWPQISQQTAERRSKHLEALHG